MSGTVLRKPAILPLFNPFTIAGLMVLAYLALSVFMRGILGEGSGVDSLYFLMLLQAVPVVIAFSRRHFTYITFIMIFHFFQLSLPKWIQFQENPLVGQTIPMFIEAIREQTFCTLVIILVYYACRLFLFGGMVEKERFQVFTLSRVQVYALCLYVIGVPLFVKHLPAWFLSIHFLLLSADLVLLYTSTSVGNEGIIRFTKVISVVGAFNYFLHTGMMTMMGAIVSLMALVSCLQRRFRVVLMVCVAVVGMSAIQTVKGTYRSIIYLSDMDFTTIERMGILWELLSAKYLEGDDTELEDEEETKTEDIGTNLVSGFMRAGDDSLERVLASTPSKVPFWYGETYENIPVMFIPRVLWHDKPSRHFWNKFGRIYGVLASDDFSTSVGVSFLAEAYMNFGFGGMYLVSVLLGALFAVVERSAFYILGGYFYFPYIVFLTPLLAPATDLGSILNSLWLIYVVFLVGRPLLMQMARRDEYS